MISRGAWLSVGNDRFSTLCHFKSKSMEPVNKNRMNGDYFEDVWTRLQFLYAESQNSEARDSPIQGVWCLSYI